MRENFDATVAVGARPSRRSVSLVVDGMAHMDKSAPPTILIILFPLFFVGMWCAVCLVLSTMGGWRRLAESFPAKGRPSGKRFFMQAGKVGQVNYGSCLTIHSSADGLHLSVWLPFRLGHPPLFIPWSAIRNPTTQRFLWMESVEFDVLDSSEVVTLRLSKKIFEGHNVTAV